MELIQVVLQDISCIASDWPCFLNINLHVVDVVTAVAKVIGDSAKLLNFLSEHAVEGCPCLEETHV